MKILIVSQYFWPENFIINDLVSDLMGRGHSVSVLTGRPNYPSEKIFQEYKIYPEKFSEYYGAKIYRVPIFSRGSKSYSLAINYLSFVISASILGPWLLRKLVCDIMFVYEPSPVTVGLPASLISSLKKVPMVFWVQDLWPDTLIALRVARNQAVLSIIRFLVRFIYSKSTLILGQSPGFVKSIKGHCSPDRRVEYFPNWIRSYPHVPSGDPAPEIPVAPEVFTVLFTGNIGEAQDFPAVLNALEIVKSSLKMRLIVIGKGRKEDWLKREIIRRNLEETIILLGHFPAERIPSFYLASDALLVSLKKGDVFSLTIPSKVQSYLVSGLPVLGMLDGDGAKVLLDADVGYVCPAGDYLGLARNIKKIMLMSQTERVTLGRNGNNYANIEFNSTLLVDKLENWFVEVCKKNAP